jgi:hypothetical protein
MYVKFGDNCKSKRKLLANVSLMLIIIIIIIIIIYFHSY